MTKAIVKLIGCETHGARGRNFKKGFPQTITNPADIAYYQNQGQYSVRIIAEPSAKQPAKPPVIPPVEPSAVPPEGNDDDDEVEIEILTKEQLKGMKKKELAVAGEERLVLFTGKEKNSEMIKEILKAQDQLQADENEDDDDEDNDE